MCANVCIFIPRHTCGGQMSLFPPCGSWWLNAGHQAWWQVSTGLAHLASLQVSNFILLFSSLFWVCFFFSPNKLQSHFVNVQNITSKHAYLYCGDSITKLWQSATFTTLNLILEYGTSIPALNSPLIHLSVFFLIACFIYVYVLFLPKYWGGVLMWYCVLILILLVHY